MPVCCVFGSRLRKGGWRSSPGRENEVARKLPKRCSPTGKLHGDRRAPTLSKSCRNAAPNLSNTCSGSRGQHWPNVAELGQTRPKLANIGQMLGKIGQAWPSSAKIRPTSTTSGQMLATSSHAGLGVPVVAFCVRSRVVAAWCEQWGAVGIGQPSYGTGGHCLRVSLSFLAAVLWESLLSCLEVSSSPSSFPAVARNVLEFLPDRSIRTSNLRCHHHCNSKGNYVC